MLNSFAGAIVCDGAVRRRASRKWRRPMRLSEGLKISNPPGRRGADILSKSETRYLDGYCEGGCGVVYTAEQEKPVRRRVALKVIKLGMDTKKCTYAQFHASDSIRNHKTGEQLE